MNGGYHQSFCASCRQCLCCRLRRNCRCTPLPVLDWSRDHTRDGALDFRKKKISRQNNTRDLPAMKQHLTRENPQVDWNSMDEIVVNLCMNCDRKWRKFRDGYIHEHDHHSTDHSTADTRSSDGLAIPSTSHRPLNTEPRTLQDELEEPIRSFIDPPREPSSDIPTTRKRRRRYAAMSELHQLTSSNFGKL